MATSKISAEKMRLIRALKPLSGLSESALKRFSESDLQTMLDSYGGTTPAAGTTPPPTGGGTTPRGGGTGMTDPEIECGDCKAMGLSTKVPASQLLPHQLMFHKDKYAALFGGAPATTTPATPAPPTPPATGGGTPPPSGGTGPSAPPKKKLKMPQFVGRNVNDVSVQTDLFSGGFNRGTDETASDPSKADGYILGQRPPAGTEYEEGSAPELTFMVNQVENPPTPPASSGGGMKVPGILKKFVGTVDDFNQGIGS
jgi:hypothetical protein